MKTRLPGARILFLLITLAATAMACDGSPADDRSAYTPSLAFDSARIAVVSGADTIPLRVELAITAQQQTMGLMERQQLAPDAGMLFVYDSVQPPSGGFWMYRTRIPLDIAFADSAGVIGTIHTMQPCETTLPEGCRIYEAGVPFRYALEMSAGFFAQRGIAIGDRILVGGVGAGAP